MASSSSPPSPQKTIAPPPLIIAGSHVVVQKVGGEHIRVCRLRAGQKINIEKLQFDPAAAVGQQFGMFEVSGGQLTRVESPTIDAVETSTTLLSSMIGGGVANSADKLSAVGGVSLPGDSYDNTTTSNSSVVGTSLELRTNSVIDDDASTNPQRLTHCEIEALKNREGGVRTAELVSRLVDGNRAFADRTLFSQQKYVQKKAKKHSDLVILSRPTLRLLCECHYRPNPDKVANLRMDLLALMLQLSAIHHGSKVLVFEQVMGLLVSGVVERLGGAGTCIHLHQGNVAQSVPAVASMEFTEEQLSTLRSLSIATLLSGPTEPPTAESNGIMNGEDVADGGEPAKKRGRLQSEREAMEMMLLGKGAGGGGVKGSGCDYGSLDSVLLAIKNVSAVDILQHVYASLRLSGTVVIYSSVQKHVLLAYDWLKERGAVQVQLMEQSQRLHQVIDGRTHPFMHQAVAGGYLLSAIKVKPKEPPAIVK